MEGKSWRVAVQQCGQETHAQRPHLSTSDFSFGYMDSALTMPGHSYSHAVQDFAILTYEDAEMSLARVKIKGVS